MGERCPECQKWGSYIKNPDGDYYECRDGCWHIWEIGAGTQEIYLQSPDVNAPSGSKK